MARSYTSRSTAIWREDDFRALSAEEQHLLFLIESQPDISAAGTLPLTLRRWAAMFRGGTVESVRKTLTDLENAGRVVVDDDTDELLLCSFVADDRGYVNSKRRPVILKAAAGVVSMPVRRALAREFRRLGLPVDGLSLPPDPGGPAPSERTDDAPASPQPEPVQSDESRNEGEPEAVEKPQENRASDRASQFRGDVGCKGEYLAPPTHNPHLSSRNPSPRGAAGLVANALGIDDDETREVIDRIRRLHKPRNLSGYIRTMADNDDLQPVLDDLRRDKERRAATLARQAARAAETIVEPPPSSVTPEQAAADRAALRQFLAGRGPAPGGDPMRLGDVIGKAANS